jgi:hypothetical protein
MVPPLRSFAGLEIAAVPLKSEAIVMGCED